MPNCNRARLSALPDTLTPSQTKVLQRYANGMDRKAVAADLWLTSETVKSHLRDISARLGSRGVTHSVAIALRRGLID